MLALNLHYLLTAYGKGGTTATGGNQLEAQHLLAHAMSFVNDNSMLTRDHVRDAIDAYSGGPQPPYARLSGSDLDGQVELVKLTQLSLTPEEISKLWSALNQSYRLSVAYEASVVLVHASEAVPCSPAGPDGAASTRSRSGGRGSIRSRLRSRTLGGTLTITGSNLASRDAVRLRFPPDDVAAADVIAAGSVVRDSELRVEVSRVHARLAQGLRAGPVSVRVLHQIRMGLPPAPGSRRRSTGVSSRTSRSSFSHRRSPATAVVPPAPTDAPADASRHRRHPDRTPPVRRAHLRRTRRRGDGAPRPACADP